MNESLKSWLSLISQLGAIIIALVAPLLFWNFTSEFYETPKFLLVIVVTGIMLTLWAARSVIDGKTTVIRSPLDLPLLLLLAVFIISAFFAVSKSVAVFGNLPQINFGLGTYVVYTLFYFALLNSLKSPGVIKQTVHALIFSGVVLSALSLLSYAGINIFSLEWTGHRDFTPAGSNFSTTALLTLLLPFPLIKILWSGKKEHSPDDGLLPARLEGIPAKLVSSVLATLFAAVIVLTGSQATYIATAAAFVLVLFVSPPQTLRNNLYFVAIPVVSALLLAFFSFLPLGGDQNILYTRANNFPREIQLPLSVSWKVSVSAFRDSPFWGSGPASFLADFTAYKPTEVNNTQLWNIRFDQAFNEYLHYLATLGAMGLTALILLTVIFVSKAIKTLTNPYGSLDLSLSSAGIIFFILLALHASTTFLWITGVLILALFMASRKELTREFHIGTTAAVKTARTEEELNVNFDALSILFFIAVILICAAGFYLVGKAAFAGYYHRQALLAVSKGNGLEAYNQLVAAEQLNPNVDLYRADLARTNFALANAIAAKGPSESSPSGSLTDQDKANIQTLLSQSINEARLATALNPGNPSNWETLGWIYRQVSGITQNALAFSLDSYGRAIQRDPLNPTLRLTVGGIYYSVKNFDMAIRFFTDAVNLKPDFASGYYNLAIALKEKGDISSAAQSAEKAVSLLDPKSSDYKIAGDLLADLKARVASKTAEKAESRPVTPPAVKTNSVLEGKNLPKDLINLPKPEKIATPEAVKAPKPSPTPKPTEAPAQPTATPQP